MLPNPFIPNDLHMVCHLGIDSYLLQRCTQYFVFFFSSSKMVLVLEYTTMDRFFSNLEHYCQALNHLNPSLSLKRNHLLTSNLH